MRRLKARTSLNSLVITILILTGPKAGAQVEADFLKAGVNDGMKLMEAYIEPFANAFGAGFNSSWYNTAKPHKLGGFDVTLSVSAGFVPADALEFDLAAVEFENLALVDPMANTMAPTVAGAKENGPELHFVQTLPSSPGTEIELVSFESPPGINFTPVPSPMLQVGIGLPYASEIKLRYIPTTPVDEGSVRLLGGGLMKSISEHIKAFTMLPLNISVFGGYNTLRGEVPISVEPDTDINYVSYSMADFTDQYFIVDVSAWTVSLIASVDIPVVSGYLGIGYGKTLTNMNIEGYIPLPVLDPDISTSNPVYTDEGVVEEVEKISIENYSGLRFNVGGRLKLGVFTIHTDYTYASYNVLTVGLGVSFR
ncbi:MAG: DUF6588 family protein [Bacteroidota bacterium]